MPDDQETHYLLGRALAEQASTPEAFAAAEQELLSVVKRQPKEPTVHLALGILHFRRNEPGKAIRELEQAVRLRSTETKTMLYLGQSYMRVGRTAEGKSALAQFEKIGRLSRSISQLENRLHSTPESTPDQRREKNEVRLRLIRVYMEDRQFDRALNNCYLVLESDPGNAEALRVQKACKEKLAAR